MLGADWSRGRDWLSHYWRGDEAPPGRVETSLDLTRQGVS